MDYWIECISEALDDAGVNATKEQIEIIAGFVEISHENYGMAMGYDAIPNPVVTREGEELRKMKAEKAAHENWVSRTKPCKSCTTTGWVLDGWGRDQTCATCGGKGRY